MGILGKKNQKCARFRTKDLMIVSNRVVLDIVCRTSAHPKSMSSEQYVFDQFQFQI